MKNLQEIVHFLGLPLEESGTEERQAVDVANLYVDARQVGKGDLFIALQGFQYHGLNFLEQAMENGAAAILSDRALSADEVHRCQSLPKVPNILVVEDLKHRLGALANWFYNCPSEQLRVVGITGTNGKTSTAHYVAQLLIEMGQTPALIGTLGNGVVKNHRFDRLDATANTTPDVVTVHRLLNEYRQAGANWVVMEVSSHALELGRIEAVRFECVALTQVTRDHLDFHGTERAYQQAKTKLFHDYESRFQVVNIEDDVGRALYESCSNVLGYCAYHCETQCSHDLLCCRSQRLMSRGLSLELQWGSDVCSVELGLIGRFNVENVLCALSILRVTGFDWQACCVALKRLKPVAGRMERVLSAPSVIVDFAHTPDALEKVMQSIRMHLEDENQARLHVVFGCGGERDRGKRPLMAEVAERYADRVVLTSDNPRNEPMETIIADTLAGFRHPQQVEVVMDRREAIFRALEHADDHDLVLIAGKGHEDYQDVGGQKEPFSDRQVALDWAQGRD